VVFIAGLAACSSAPSARHGEPISLTPVEKRAATSLEGEAEPTSALELHDLPIRPFTESERGTLNAALAELRVADLDQRDALLGRIEHHFGGRGLVAALDVLPDTGSENPVSPSRHWFITKQLFERLEQLADPSCGDDLLTWWSRSKDEHWKGRAAAVLAMLGDPRAATGLARRMRYESSKLYVREKFWQADAGGHLSRSDRWRVVSARLLADLATLHPAHLQQLRATAEPPVLRWMLKTHAPHANAMRFLALAQSNKGGLQLSHWATPTEPLPEVGAVPPFPQAFEVAQSALRYYGASRREAALEALLAQLKRKPAALDVSQEALSMGTGMAMRGMALRAVTYGAANGLAELGDERTYEALAMIATDPLQHEETREAASRAMAWCASPSNRMQMAAAVLAQVSSPATATEQQAVWYAASLAQRPTPDISETLVTALERAQSAELRKALAAALAASGVEDVEARLIAMLRHDDSRPAAAAALILAGSESGARRAAHAAKDDGEAGDTLVLVANALGPTDEHLARGTYDRWAVNYAAISKKQPWITERLNWVFEVVMFDHGPHTMTRVVLRRRLIERALRGSPRQQGSARTLLELMQERGALWYLARHASPIAGQAAETPPHGH